MASAKGESVSSGVAYGEGCPLSSWLRGLVERRELPQRGPGRSPGRKRDFGVFWRPIWQNLGETICISVPPLQILGGGTCPPSPRDLRPWSESKQQRLRKGQSIHVHSTPAVEGVELHVLLNQYSFRCRFCQLCKRFALRKLRKTLNYLLTFQVLSSWKLHRRLNMQETCGPVFDFVQQLAEAATQAAPYTAVTSVTQN